MKELKGWENVLFELGQPRECCGKCKNLGEGFGGEKNFSPILARSKIEGKYHAALLFASPGHDRCNTNSLPSWNAKLRMEARANLQQEISLSRVIYFDGRVHIADSLQSRRVWWITRKLVRLSQLPFLSPIPWVVLLYSSQAFSVPQSKMAAGNYSARAHSYACSTGYIAEQQRAFLWCTAAYNRLRAGYTGRWLLVDARGLGRGTEPEGQRRACSLASRLMTSQSNFDRELTEIFKWFFRNRTWDSHRAHTEPDTASTMTRICLFDPA